MPAIKTALWGILIVIVTAVASRIAARTLRKLLERDSNPLPSSSILVNITVIWALGASVLLDACFGINANALVAALGVGGIAVFPRFPGHALQPHRRAAGTSWASSSPATTSRSGPRPVWCRTSTWRHTTIRDALGQTMFIIPTRSSPRRRSCTCFRQPRGRSLAVPRLGDDGGARTEHMDALAEQLARLAGDAAGGIPRHRRAARPVSENLRNSASRERSSFRSRMRRRRAWRPTPWSVPSRHWCKRSQRSSISKRGQAPN